MPFCPRVMICEGYEDVRFFKKFIQERDLPEFRIMDTSTESDRQGGISKFKRAINALKLKNQNQFNILSDILLVADNDSNPTENFELVRAQIDELYPGLAPDRPMVKSAGRPFISVLMLPWAGEDGHLEKLCGDAFRHRDAVTGTHVDTFMANIGADRWSESRRAKAWLRSDIAARASDPCCSLPAAIEARPSLLDFYHPSLSRVANYLRTFA